jgi:putative endonuclease
MTNKFTGRNGENIAKNYLVEKGYKILETNRRFSRICEIDIIATDKDTLVFCEVKTRSSVQCGHPFEAITPEKYKNIKAGLYLYLEENPNYKLYRIDAISVILRPKLEIQHLKNI